MVTWRHRSYDHSISNMLLPIGTEPLSSAILKIIACKKSGSRTWPVGVTWPYDTTGAIFYRCSIVTEFLSPAFFKIMGPKHIGVTTLTFLGHVTSSATRPFDSPGAISCRCSIVTESLSAAMYEIMGPVSWVVSWLIISSKSIHNILSDMNLLKALQVTVHYTVCAHRNQPVNTD